MARAAQTKPVSAVARSQADSALGKAAERRDKRRFRYNRVQYISFTRPEDGRRVTDFQAVQCYDLSTGGLSYFTDRLPPTTTLVVLLGSAPDFTYLRAEVRFMKRLGSGRLHVGCKFLDRIDAERVR
jgi:hypothetical protein